MPGLGTTPTPPAAIRSRSNGWWCPDREIAGVLKVDFQEGTVRIDDDDEGHPPASLVLAWFEGEIETELLDSLHARWSRARGLDPRRRVQPEAPEPGERIFWSDVYPNAREDRYLIGASSFLIEELVCVEPNCECSEARLVVFDVSDGGYGNEVGSWLVREEAVVEYQSTLFWCPADLTALAELGKLEDLMGDIGHARRLYEGFLAVAPPGPARDDITERLRGIAP